MISFKNSCDGAYDSIDVRFTKTCNNACSFCIEKNGIPAKKQDVEAMAKSVLSLGIDDVLIVGGEPLLEPKKTLEFLRLIRGKINNIFLTTSLPSSFMEDESVIDEIMGMLTCLNVTVQSLNSEENNRIFRTKDKHNRLAALRSLAKKYNNKIRVSINLSKSGINDRKKLLSSLAALHMLGIRNVKINELQRSTNDNSKNTDHSEYVSFEDIMETKMPSPYASGCQTKVEFILFYDMNIVVKRSCFMVEPSRKATFMDTLKVAIKRIWKRKNRFFVVYEDGEISKGWKSNE